MSQLLLSVVSLLGVSGYTDGSLVVLLNSNKPVSSFTGSAVTHVALIGRVADSPWVYEATPAKVRRLPWAEYVEEVSSLNSRREEPMRVWVLEPKQQYSFEEVAALHRYFHTQLGRRYSVKGYLRGKAGDGIHCAEFCLDGVDGGGTVSFRRAASAEPGRCCPCRASKLPAAATCRAPRTEGLAHAVERTDSGPGDNFSKLVELGLLRTMDAVLVSGHFRPEAPPRSPSPLKNNLRCELDGRHRARQTGGRAAL